MSEEAVPESRGGDLWADLRRTTQARIGLGRSGNSLPTQRVLEFQAAHAAARDAVHDPLDVDELTSRIAGLGVGDPVHIASRAASRAEYLRRPDLGRLPRDLTALPAGTADLAIVLADGLSPRALDTHGPGLFGALVDILGPQYRIAAPVIATQSRVAIGDPIGVALGVSTVIVVIGERPGLSVADSLGVYLTHGAPSNPSDADRNCVSNIHPPDGLGYAAAAAIVAGLLSSARMLGRSGVDVKDTSRGALQ
ncbi:ethanolamine ammonia-lyase subunit EutC [Gordonia sp. ABSL1-1]|uniref:ethanolamine ammonia-lyase subunit EutC n=1 Tax=Gordonia sp. ABSL1-1 TaxID=3053923 RepID=UPI00257387CF|nr:ethanolamine ammonia-lyase subunit EutC [Gordonia sp. ABSL1-1]MDL9938132.1 ethanolamine ammonia-lyase subunit EutC [Gordonia sp. ABSL1-1]